MEAPLPRRIAWFAPWTWSRRYAIALLTLAILSSYPLSAGPVYGMVDRGIIPYEYYETIYRPLLYCAMRNRTVAEAYWLYTDLFAAPLSLPRTVPYD